MLIQDDRVHLDSHLVDIKFVLENLASNSDLVAHLNESLAGPLSQAQTVAKANTGEEVLLNQVHFELLPRRSCPLILLLTFCIHFLILAAFPRHWLSLFWGLHRFLSPFLVLLLSFGKGMMGGRKGSERSHDGQNDRVYKREVPGNTVRNGQNRLIAVGVHKVVGT